MQNGDGRKPAKMNFGVLEGRGGRVRGGARWGGEGGHVVKDREQCREPSVTLLHRRQRGLNESNNKAACHVE